MDNKSLDLVRLAKETKRLTALIVEDEKEANRLLSATFSNFFNRVHTTFSGAEGLEAYEKYKPDVVFIDIMMDGMDGVELSRKIREINRNQIIAIISASDNINKISETIEIGINSFVQKPINTQKIIDLLNAIVQVIRKRKKIETKTFSISLPLDIYEIVDESARAESISKNAIVIRALREYFKNKHKEEEI
ncbi:MAG TPA: response regulator [Campylobacterales bacterium]|nr:response regulator [Campylobacterales bacterium]HIO71015.1 response regulator [Campylobacterales bacterium]